MKTRDRRGGKEEEREETAAREAHLYTLMQWQEERRSRACGGSESRRRRSWFEDKRRASSTSTRRASSPTAHVHAKSGSDTRPPSTNDHASRRLARSHRAASPASTEDMGCSSSGLGGGGGAVGAGRGNSSISAARVRESCTRGPRLLSPPPSRADLAFLPLMAAFRTSKSLFAYSVNLWHSPSGSKTANLPLHDVEARDRRTTAGTGPIRLLEEIVRGKDRIRECGAWIG